MDFYKEILDMIVSGNIHSKLDLHRIKVKLCKKYKMGSIPPDSEIIARLPDDFSEEDRDSAISLLRIKSTRTISGVAIVAVMTSPEDCPHGRCVPCPGGVGDNTPQSYTGYEPAALRAILNDFDPFLQTKNRLNQLKAIGHPVDKIDFILMGGTFTARNPFYQEWFVKRCFDALNNSESKSLFDAKIKNETARSRCIGLTIETRPDWFRLQHADQILNFSATRVELGVQSVFDDILFKMKRGHTVSDSIFATRIAKNCGLKVCYHLMPGLPGSDKNKDLECFQIVFDDQQFKPDMIKIYPTLTIKGTELYNQWKKGKYFPLDTTKASFLIAEIKDYIPEWVRIQRIQRDVPSPYIEAGVNRSNLRQYVEDEMKRQNINCRCIRCREFGHKSLKQAIQIDDEKIILDCVHYDASDSEEVFISLVEPEHDALIGYLRLRDIKNSHRGELLKNPCTIIRELRVVGREIPIGVRSKDGLQHKGYGKELINEAEKLTIEEFDKKHIFVLSGVGVKNYYRNLGFKDNGVYLSKTLI